MNQSRPTLSVLGIDPGADGAACLLTLRGPSMSLQTIRFKPHRNTPPNWVHVYEKLQTVFSTSHPLAVYMEKVGGRPDGIAVTEFTFGENCGRVKMMLDLLKVNTLYVHPQTWQAAMFAGLVRGDTGNKNKRLTHEAISRFFPNLDVRHDGIADAILLALFGAIMEGLIINPFAVPQKKKGKASAPSAGTNRRKAKTV